FNGVEAGRVRVLPGWAERLGMVDRDQCATRRGGLHDLAGRVLGRLAEIPPRTGAPGIPVPAVGGDLDAGQDDRQVLAANGRVLGVVSDLVVIGHTQEVEAAGDGFTEHVGGPGVTVGVQGVAVQVTAQPVRLGRGFYIRPQRGGRER